MPSSVFHLQEDVVSPLEKCGPFSGDRVYLWPNSPELTTPTRPSSRSLPVTRRRELTLGAQALRLNWVTLGSFSLRRPAGSVIDRGVDGCGIKTWIVGSTRSFVLCPPPSVGYADPTAGSSHTYPLSLSCFSIPSLSSRWLVNPPQCPQTVQSSTSIPIAKPTSSKSRTSLNKVPSHLHAYHPGNPVV